MVVVEDVPGEVVHRAVCRRADLTLAAAAVLMSVNDLRKGLSCSSSEPEHSEICCSDLREDRALQSHRLSWRNWPLYWSLED